MASNLAIEYSESVAKEYQGQQSSHQQKYSPLQQNDDGRKSARFVYLNKEISAPDWIDSVAY